jgi:hypothetical protein
VFTLLRVVAVLGALAFCAGVLAAHRLRADLPALQTTLSVYFSGRTRAWMLGAYLALALALLAVAIMLASTTPSVLRALAALLCLLTALCLVPIGLTARQDTASTDARSPVTVRLHRWTALLAFVSIVAAILGYAASMAMPPWVQVAAFALGAIALAALSGMVLIRPGPYHGAMQKVLAAAMVSWIALVSFTEGMG